MNILSKISFVSGANAVLEFNTISIVPYPIRIHSGETLTLQVMLNLLVGTDRFLLIVLYCVCDKFKHSNILVASQYLTFTYMMLDINM